MSRARKEPTPYYDEQRDLWIAEIPLGLNERGRRKRKRVTARTEPECRRKLRAALHALDNGLPLVDERRTVRGWCEQYVAEILPYGRAKKSAASHGRVLADYVYPYPIARKPLAALTPADVRRWLRTLEQRDAKHKRDGEVVKLAPGTVAKARSVLSAAITAAVRDEVVTRNVVHLTEPPEHASEPREVAMTPEQVDAVLACSAAGLPVYRCGTNELLDERRPDRFYPLAVLVLALGNREAELLDLRWPAVDLDAATLEVVDAKTPAGVRTVPLPDFVVDALTAHRAAQRRERLAAPIWGDDGLVFPSTRGTRMSARNLLRWWHALTTRAGVGRQPFHGARHTAATVMLNRGVPLELVSEILGHASTAVTRKFYARPNVELLRVASRAMETAYTLPTSSASS